MARVNDARRLSALDPEERDTAIAATAGHLKAGDIVVIPTDTVYGVAADAFNHTAVTLLLAAKGRGRDMPPPVLVANIGLLDVLAREIPEWARALANEFWPGALTLVLHAQNTLAWDLGETQGTVALRVPDHEVTKAILERTGPLAVSSANLTGQPAAVTADEAEAMLGDVVAAILDAGPASNDPSEATASTIIDATGSEPRLLRKGAIDVGRLNIALAPFQVGVEDD